jgi:hypothetical protein
MLYTSIAAHQPLPSKTNSQTQMQEKQLLVHLTVLLTGINSHGFLVPKRQKHTFCPQESKKLHHVHSQEKGCDRLKIRWECSFNPSDNRIFWF